jgi:hypothetical protein
LKDLIPDGHTIGLVLSSPILQLRKTKARLAMKLRDYIADLTSLRDDQKIEINGNKITVYLNQHGEAGYKKVSAAITNRDSNQNILKNVLHILEDRIVTKARKCEQLDRNCPVWLVLLNDYWLTEPDTYRYALTQMSLAHRFRKILLVDGDGSVHVLYAV